MSIVQNKDEQLDKKIGAKCVLCVNSIESKIKNEILSFSDKTEWNSCVTFPETITLESYCRYNRNSSKGYDRQNFKQSSAFVEDEFKTKKK